MNNIPLSEACLSEVLARVSFRILHRLCYQNDWANCVPEQAFTWAYEQLHEDGFPILATWVLAYKREWSPMTPTKFVRDAFIFRARQGWTWRRVVFPQYKSNRSDPRVTNRGVAREGLSQERPQ